MADLIAAVARNRTVHVGVIDPEARTFKATADFWFPGHAIARLSHDGRHLFAGGSVRALQWGHETELDNAAETSADGCCVALLMSDRRRVRVLRSDPAGFAIWEEYTPEQETVTDIDVAMRGTACDVAVVGRNATTVHRLAPSDTVDLRAADSGRRLAATRRLGARALIATAERSFAAHLEPLLDAGTPGERAAVIRALRVAGETGLDALVRAVGSACGDEVLDGLSAEPAAELARAAERCLISVDAASRIAGLTLLRRRPDIQLEGRVLAALEDPDGGVRAAAVAALVPRRDLAALPPLVLVLDDEDASVVAAARTAVSDILTAAGMASDAVLQAVNQASGLRVFVKCTLDRGGLGDPRRAHPLFDALAANLVGRGAAPTLNALDVLAPQTRESAAGTVLRLVAAGALADAGELDAARQALPEPSDTMEPALRWGLHAEFGRLAEAAGDDHGALREYILAMGIIDVLWSELLGNREEAHFFADKAVLYDRALLCQLRLGHAAEALATLERAKTRYLGDLIARQHAPPERALERRDVEFWSRLRVSRSEGEVDARAMVVAGVDVEPAPGQVRQGAPRALAALLRDLDDAEESWSIRMVSHLWRLDATDGLRRDASELPDELARLADVAAAAAEATADGTRPAEPQVFKRLDRAYDEAVDALAAAGVWALKEWKDHRWLESYLRDPVGPDALVFAAVREAAEHLAGRRLAAVDANAGDLLELSKEPSRSPVPVFTTVDAVSAERPGDGTQDVLTRAIERHWEAVERVARGKTVGVGAAAPALAAGRTALLEFAVTAEETIVFTATVPDSTDRPFAAIDGPFTYKTRSVSSDRLADALIAAYGDPDETGQLHGQWPKVLDDACCRLYSELFEPLVPWLRRRKVERLLVVPHRGLHRMPIAAWHSRGRRGRRRYVVDDYDIVTVPSLTLDDVCRAREADRADAGSPLVLTAPKEDLPLADLQAEPFAFTGPIPPATLQRLHAHAATASLVHFAGHGEYRWNAPLTSNLSLADGHLTLEALFDASVLLPAARFVSLIGCETTLVDTRDPADEYLGLASGFLFAGVPTILATLWKIGDLPAAMLSSRFHEQCRKRMRPSKALADAQRWLRDDVTPRTIGRYLAAVRHSLKARGALDSRPGLDRAIERQSDIMKQRPGRERPYGGPENWAAFVLTGTDEYLRERSVPSR